MFFTFRPNAQMIGVVAPSVAMFFVVKKSISQIALHRTAVGNDDVICFLSFFQGLPILRVVFFNLCAFPFVADKIPDSFRSFFVYSNTANLVIRIFANRYDIYNHLYSPMWLSEITGSFPSFSLFYCFFVSSWIGQNFGSRVESFTIRCAPLQ